MTDPAELRRLRWRCRRGMLEVDLLLQRFLDRHLSSLDAAQIAALDTLLGYPDNELRDVFMGRSQCPDPRLQAVARLIEEI
jgi:antitoxin CptB